MTWRWLRFDGPGTLALVGVLAAYALAMTTGRGHFGLMNATLLAAGLAGIGLFITVESRVASPLIRLAAFRDAQFSAGLATNAIVATVMMATLVVGPFYLSRTLRLNEALVGMVISIGPIISVFTGVLVGRLVDRAGAALVVILGLVEMAAGSTALTILPSMFGVAGYIAAIVVLTPGYQLFQAANNTAVMKDVSPDRRGLVSGMLSLSRNIGLITGASVMGAVFAFAADTSDITTAPPGAVATGMRVTFAVAAALIVIAIGIRGLAVRFAVPLRRSRSRRHHISLRPEFGMSIEVASTRPRRAQSRVDPSPRGEDRPRYPQRNDA